MVFTALIAVTGCGGKAEESQPGGVGGAVASGGASPTPTPTAIIGGILPEPACAEYCTPTTQWDPDAGVCSPSGAACLTAADCHSSLPHSCLICPDGSMACAHHECVEGTCQVVTCDPPERICGDCYRPCPAGMICGMGEDNPVGTCAKGP